MSGLSGIRKITITYLQCAFRVKESGFQTLSYTTGDKRVCFNYKL